MSASEAARDLVYFTFNDEETFDDLNALSWFIQDREMTVSDLYKHIMAYCDFMNHSNSESFDSFQMLDFFKAFLDPNRVDVDDDKKIDNDCENRDSMFKKFKNFFIKNFSFMKK